MPWPRNTPNPDRRRQVVELRAEGLTLQKIADRLGCSNLRVHEILTREGEARLAQIRCQECAKEITRLRKAVDGDRFVWCLQCLAHHPEATFGQRLKAHRLAAGLTTAAVARRSGVARTLLIRYELDRNGPTQRNLVKLKTVFALHHEIMQRDEESMQRVVSLANALEQRVRGDKADLEHPLTKPIEVADGRLQRPVDLRRLPALDCPAVHPCLLLGSAS
jgi:transcriptional regulator with XRE-family HTH domain